MFVHNTSVSEETASIFMKIASVGWLGDMIVMLWIAFLFVKRRIRSWMIFVFMFLPLMIFSYYIWTDQLISGFSKYYYGWGLSYYTDAPIFYIWVGYYAVVVMIQMYLLGDCILKTTNSVEKKKAWLIFICSGITALAGTTIDVFLPAINFHLIPDLADIVFLIWAIFVIYAIVRYNFLVLTPKLAAVDILATMADSLILVSPEGKIISANQYTLDLLNYEKGALAGKSIKMLFSEQKENPFTGSNLRELTDKGSLRDLDVSYRTKNGKEIPMSFSGSTMKDKAGNLVGVVCISRDMREINRLIQKEKELAVTEAVVRTEHEKAQELTRAYSKLESTQAILVQSEKLRALGQLGADVAYELKNPLEGIICLMGAYKNKLSEASEECDDIQEMEKGLEFMARIIKDLSDFTKESTGEFTKVDCNEIIYSTLSFVTNRIIRNRIKIKKNLEKDLSFVLGDERQLQQLIMNIVNNARDAIGSDGVIKISTSNIETEKGQFVEIKIEDNGSGMDKDVRDKIFDHFFTTKRPGGGVGLGLSMVHAILRIHKGEINVKSEKENGTIFIIRLPALK